MVDIPISNRSGKPIYEQVAEGIRAQIMSGDLAPGEQLPSIRAESGSLRI